MYLPCVSHDEESIEVGTAGAGAVSVTFFVGDDGVVDNRATAAVSSANASSRSAKDVKVSVLPPSFRTMEMALGTTEAVLARQI